MTDKTPTSGKQAKPADETVAGGKYIVNGVEVDANGEPLKGTSGKDGDA